MVQNNMQGYVALDFETYSDVDLRTCGLDNYSSSEYFQVLVAGLAWQNELGELEEEIIDFINTPHETAMDTLRDCLRGKIIIAHNAGFERAVLKAMGIVLPGSDFLDTAVLARAAGYGGSLQAAAMQALNKSKVEEGAELIKRFCIPQREQIELGERAFDPRLLYPLGNWYTFKDYCVQDARLSFALAQLLLQEVSNRETAYAALTSDMNETGWHVDMDLVRMMNGMYKANLDAIISDFRLACDAPDLNLNSTTQLIEWCKERGVTVSSFDEKSVASLRRRVAKRIELLPEGDTRLDGLREVLTLAMVKQSLGGSSLKKLDVIERTTNADGRLRNQYMHVGAAATYRTSGRGVQLQNLKRLHGEGDDVSTVGKEHWSNDQLASNIRQVFTASDPQGQLIVGDFSSVESRGLAWQAGERWKIDAYHAGQDLYKVQASQMFSVPVDQITKEQRQIGKVAELSCGYGAGPGAVKDFAAKMGVDLSEGESTKLVRDWREANPEIVAYWGALDDAMRKAMTTRMASVVLPYGDSFVRFTATAAPASLMQQTKDMSLKSLYIQVFSNGGNRVDRVIHGVYFDGRGISYWKPSERKTGALWVDRYTDPKTKKVRKYSLYGGKMSGLLTQSLCREVFFLSLHMVDAWVSTAPNVQLIGQFHDEIVLEWNPKTTAQCIGFEQAKQRLTSSMTNCILPSFPLAADVKSSYRYTK